MSRRTQPPYSLDRAALQAEVRIDTFRASGPGGQHVQKTRSAVRLTHLPSGVVVIAQDSPSQLRNRTLAFERLIKKLRALNTVPKKRRPTTPTQAAKKRRVASKQARAKTKSRRGRVAELD